MKFSKVKILLTVVLSGVLSSAGATTVQIHEVLYDGIGGDADDVFTELTGAPGQSLDGWSLKGVNGGNGSVYRTVDLSGVLIPDDGLLLIVTGSALAPLAAMADFVANVDWQNGPDAVQLWFGDLLVDALQYGDAGVYNAGEGQPAGLAAAGQSLARNIQGSDSNNNVVDFTAGVSTPGIGPDPVPVPAAVWLFGSALMGLGWMRRKTGE